MSEESNKTEKGIYSPLWYLQFNSRYSKYQRRIIILSIYLILGVYVWVPFGSPELQIRIEDVYFYYIIFYAFFFISGYILWKFLYTKYKLNPSEALAYHLFKVSLS